jgi:hypothetical protein
MLESRPIDLDAVYPELQRRLELWSGQGVLRHALSQHPHFSCFLAGGVVRNLCIDPSIPIRDLDFFLAGPDLEAALHVFAEHGRLSKTPYGSPRWHSDREPDQYADLIPIRDFRPGLWPCEDILDVLNQFDFTASALAYDVRTSVSFNPQNGLRDIASRTMRMVRFDYPDEPFVPGAPLTRSAILWFRVLHYASLLGLNVEPLTRRWLTDRIAYRDQLETFSRLFFRPHHGYLACL